MQALNVILQKFNYKSIFQTIDSFNCRAIYFQLLQKCENIVICKNVSFVSFINFIRADSKIGKNINIIQFFHDKFSHMHIIYQTNKTDIAKRKTQLLNKVEHN